MHLNTWMPKASLQDFLKFLPRNTERQTLLLSATVPDEVLWRDSYKKRVEMVVLFSGFYMFTSHILSYPTNIL